MLGSGEVKGVDEDEVLVLGCGDGVLVGGMGVVALF